MIPAMPDGGTWILAPRAPQLREVLGLLLGREPDALPVSASDPLLAPSLDEIASRLDLAAATERLRAHGRFAPSSARVFARRVAAPCLGASYGESVCYCANCAADNVEDELHATPPSLDALVAFASDPEAIARAEAAVATCAERCRVALDRSAKSLGPTTWVVAAASTRAPDSDRDGVLDLLTTDLEQALGVRQPTLVGASWIDTRCSRIAWGSELWRRAAERGRDIPRFTDAGLVRLGDGNPFEPLCECWRAGYAALRAVSGPRLVLPCARA